MEIVATDLNQAMLDQAMAMPDSGYITWRQADAMALPFEDASFDAAVCQFGAVFFPDKVTAFFQVHRVLRPGGRFRFSVWDRMEVNLTEPDVSGRDRCDAFNRSAWPDAHTVQLL